METRGLERRGRTLLAKIWDQHVIARISDDTDLLHVDRHLLHDLGGSRGLLDLKSRDLPVHNPELTFATPDHAISSAPGRAGTSKTGQELLEGLRIETSASGIAMFDIDEPGQGIVHVIGPELGLSLPGCLIVCGDSHTCTHGGLGALAFGIGSSELTHVLATQALIQRRPKTMRVRFEGRMSSGVTPKDLILALIGHVGAAGGTGYAVEYAGSAIRDMPIEGRLHDLQSCRSNSAPRWAWSRRTRKPTTISAAGATRRKARCGNARSPHGESFRAIRTRCSTAKSSSMSRRSSRR